MDPSGTGSGMWGRANRFSALSKRLLRETSRSRRKLALERFEPRLVLDGLTISEFMTVNDSTLADVDGDFEDWIEIRNTTANPIDASGWHLSDNAADLTKWQVPAGVTIAPDDHLVIFASNKDRTNPLAQLHTNFRLSGGGEYLGLIEPDGTTVATEFSPEYPEQFADISYGWSDDQSAVGYFDNPTPGANNVGEPIADLSRQVLITEIMYHPSSENDLEEYIEIYNAGTEAVDLNGWQFARGVDFTFPATVLASGEYLVVAADQAAFAAKYPGVTNVVAGWTGKLSNKSETIELVDALGTRMDQVEYADEGDWGIRMRGPLDLGHEGWIWFSEHDGLGKSLELINLAVANRHGQNWGASATDEGTPGAANSIAASDIAPLVLDVEQDIPIPRSTDAVTITAEVRDEQASGVDVSLFYRVDPAPAFVELTMMDDGAHGDGRAGDGVYGATIPAQVDGSIVEFYVEATDVGANVRSWPSAIQPGGQHLANALYQVNDAFDPNFVPGSQPTYYLVMTEAERAELADIGDGGNGNEEDTNAQMNGTFISVDGTGVSVRYSVGIRNRGHGSRNGPPNNYRVNIPHDRPWKNTTALNINSRYTHAQVIGSAIHRMAGIPVPDGTAVQVRVNGQDLAVSNNVMHGTYAYIEPLDSAFADKHYPDDSAGNLYKALRTDNGGDEADLRYEGTNPDEYRDTYFKQTNDELDDWSDLIQMTNVLNNAPQQTYLEDLSQVIDLQQWMRYLALDALLLNRETGLNRGIGDDFAMYRGVVDTRFKMVPHDLDTIMLQGNTSFDVNETIFNFSEVAGFSRLFNTPEAVQMFYKQFIDLMSTVFNPVAMNPLLDQVLGDWVPTATLDEMKQFVVDRSAAVLAQIPRDFTLGTNLASISEYRRADTDVAAVSGTADATRTGSVYIDGHQADWNPITGQWSLGESTGGSGGIVTLVQRGAASNWSFLDNGVDQGTAWREVDFDATSWDSGPAPLGYSDPDINQVIDFGPDENQKYPTYYFRHTFEATDIDEFVSVTGSIRRDDGAAIYLNGEEIFRTNLPENEDILYETRAVDVQSGAEEDQFHEFTVDLDDLAEGTNLLAVEVHQHPGNSSDIIFDLDLEAELAGGNTLSGVPLRPGVNRLQVDAFSGPDGTGEIVDTGWLHVWYDAQPQPVPNATDHELQMTVRGSYLPGTPFVVRLDVNDIVSGDIEKDFWNLTASLSSDNPAVTLSVTQLPMYNGRGSVMVTPSGTGDFNLMASVGDISTSKVLTSLEAAPITQVSGTLPGTETDWSGIVHVTDNLEVPAGHTLTIQPGTLVLLDGVDSGTDGTDIDVLGNIQSLGTAASPITFTAVDSTEAWGEIHHTDADASTYSYTHFTRGGRSPGIGHTGTGPTLRIIDSTATFDQVSVSDLVGKVMWADGGDLTFQDSHLARSVMGPEIRDTALLMEDSWITEMFGVDDNDGIYLQDQQAGQSITLRNGVVADGDDDAIDTLGSDVLIENYILRDFFDKGISVNGGATDVVRALIVDNGIGIESKQGADTTIDRSTLVQNGESLRQEDTTGTIDVSNSIIRGITDSVFVEDDPADVQIQYSNVGEAWAGTGNIDQPPGFVAGGINNFRLAPGSPSIDAGNPADPQDPDATTVDQGFYYSGEAGLPIPRSELSGVLSGDLTLTPEGSPYRVIEDLIVPDGVTLTVLPGTTVYFDAGTELTVNGRIDAVGTKHDRIRFTSDPGAPHVPDIRPELPNGPPRWGGIQIVDSSATDNIISFADVDYAQTSNGSIGMENSEALIDDVAFVGTHLRMIRTRGSSVIIRNSIFPDMFAPDEFPRSFTPALDNVSEHINAAGGIPDGGYYIIEGNVFGRNKGHNDVIDINSNQYPDPVVQIRNNVFLGGGDEAIDGGGDILIEGNLFLNFIKDNDNDGSGDSNVISTSDGGTSWLSVVRNTFVNVDHAVNFKTNAYGFFENNTIAGVSAPHLSLPTDPPSRLLDFSAINFLIPNEVDPANGRPRDTPPGRGAFTSSNLFFDIPQTVFGHVDFRNPFIDPPVDQVLEVHNSLVPASSVFDNADGVNGRQFDYIVGDPRFVDMANRDFSLRPGSPAIGAGVNGIDIGSTAPLGASISGEPPAMTTSNQATLTIGGPGVFSFRYRVNDGPWSDEIEIWTPRSDIGNSAKVRTAEIQLTDLADGDYTVFVQGKNLAQVWQTQPTASKTWTVDSQLTRLVINEVMARNDTTLENDGTFPDLIELYNAGAAALNLTGMSLTDDVADPRRFVFPFGTTIDAGEYLVLFADHELAAPGIHTDFTFDASGEGLFLYDTIANGAGLIDSVEFGLQIPDMSIGRTGHDAEWTLTQPTFGEANIEQITGDPSTLKINEWFTNGEIHFVDDFVELYNPDPLPVPLDGLHLTDDPVARPLKFQVAPLSFTAGSGFSVFWADNDPQLGKNQLNFRLNADQELIGLFDADGNELDKVLFYGQTTDISQGRSPDGAVSYEFYDLPTPGVSNASVNQRELSVIAVDDTWRYDDSGTDLGNEWRESAFDDSLWSEGAGVLGVESAALPAPIQTPLTLGQSTYYFRKQIVMPTDVRDYEIEMSTLIDDGAIVYVNGVEVLPLGVDSGATHATLANRTVIDASFEGPFTIPSSFFDPGVNVIAVELHQSAVASPDIVFGMTMDMTLTSLGEQLARRLGLLDHLRITEIMYNPIGGTPFEFVELQNTGPLTLDLTGVRFADGIEFEFPSMTLEPDEYVVVVSDQVEFQNRYGAAVNVAGQYEGALSNGGEQIILTLADPYDAAALRFEYNDTWHPTTDGDGFSMVIVDPTLHARTWDEASSWEPSGAVGGSPGRSEGSCSASVADLTCDGAVDFDDLTLLLANWNAAVSAAQGNIVETSTSVVDFNDLTLLLAQWTGPLPGGAPTLKKSEDRLTDTRPIDNRATDAVFESLDQEADKRQTGRRDRSSVERPLQVTVGSEETFFSGRRRIRKVRQ